MSNSLQPYGLYPIRLLCPRDFPGKNTGVGCHALLHGIPPTQGSNPCFLSLLHRRWILYHSATREASKSTYCNSNMLPPETMTPFCWWYNTVLKFINLFMYLLLYTKNILYGRDGITRKSHGSCHQTVMGTSQESQVILLQEWLLSG